MQAIATARNGPPDCDRFELDATVLRAYRDGVMLRAWDIGDEAAPLHAEIARLEADKKMADDAVRAASKISDETLTHLIASRRWEEESAGTDAKLADGRTVRVMTDATSQSKLTGLLVVASAQPISVQWKCADGTFASLTSADVPLMAGAVFAHVQKCFAREAELLATLATIEPDASNERRVFADAAKQFWP